MNEKKRVINFLNIPDFQIEIERIRDTSLRSVACVIAPLKSDSAKIWAASSELDGSGIVKGMELAVAKRLYRNLKIIPPNPDLYDSVNAKIIYKASRLTPVFEPERRGGLYLDFSGFDKLYGDPETFGKVLIEDIRNEFSLESRLGIANNKLISKAATNKQIIQSSLLLVKGADAINFLNPFPIDTLPPIDRLKHQSSSDILEVLDDLNLERIADVKVLDLFTLGALFPQRENEIYSMSRGIDERLVCPPQLGPIILYDIHLEESNESSLLLQTLYCLVDKASEQARKEGKQFKQFRVGLRYSDFKYREKVVRLKSLITYSYEIYDDVKNTFYFLFDRRVMVRYLSFEVKEFVENHEQLVFFNNPKTKVFKTLDQINEKFPNTISIGRTIK